MPRRVEDYRQEGGSTAINHQPLTRERLDAWADVLSASEAQRHYMNLMYEQFVQRHNEYLDREALEYLQQGVELNQFVTADDFATPLYAKTLRDFNHATERMLLALVRFEHELIDLIEPVLAENQQERLEILRSNAIRRNWFADDRRVRWLGTELRDIWTNSEARELATPDERMVMQDILLDYEMRLTPLVRSHKEAMPRFHERQVALMIAYAEGRIDANERSKRTRQLYVNGARSARRIRLLHESTIQLIDATISDSVASAFIADIKRSVFPEVYPDRTAIKSLFAALLESDDLNEKERTHVLSLRNEYTFDYERISRELEDTCVEWGQRSLEGFMGYEHQFLPDALKPLLEQRRALSRKFLTILLDDLGADVLEAHIDLIPAGLAGVAETDSPTATPEPEPDR